MAGERRLLAIQPLEHPVLPEAAMLDELENGVGCGCGLGACLFPGETLEDLIRGDVRSFSGKRARDYFAHAGLVVVHDSISPFLILGGDAGYP
jgi:hypothetical protein